MKMESNDHTGGATPCEILLNAIDNSMTKKKKKKERNVNLLDLSSLVYYMLHENTFWNININKPKTRMILVY